MTNTPIFSPELSREIASAKVLDGLSALWLGNTQWAPDATTTAFEADRKRAESVPQLDAIARLTVTLAKMESGERKLINELRDLLKARPEVLPTVATVMAARLAYHEETPHAIARREYEAAEKVRKQRAKESATVSAIARNPARKAT